MAISEAPFENEMELQTWVINNIAHFLPGSIFMPGCSISTTTGKSGIPDGYAFNFSERQWYIIENELLHHGVWPHIAEQVVRFVVASQNSDSRRKLRDRLFEQIMKNGDVEETCRQLSTTRERLLQQLELFIEGVDPQIAIFIDETNRDLHEMAQALDAETKIFRIQKFIVDGRVDYHSPDRHAPVISTEPSENARGSDSDFEIVEILGGGKLEDSDRRFRCYRLQDERIVHVKRSKFHQRNNYYWYGISPVSLENAEHFNVTHFIFVMGDEGFVTIPIDTVCEFVAIIKSSYNEDGSVRHYHALISPGPEPVLFFSNELPKVELRDEFTSF
jgi:hypothetical protein